MSNNRGLDIKKIHMAKRDLALTDDSYQALLLRVTQLDSSAGMNSQQRDAVLAEFANLGWKPKAPKKKSGVRYSRATSRKLQAQWIALAKAKKVHNRSNPALLEWVSRQTGREDLKTLDWLTTQEASKCIDALKAWLERE